MDSVDKEINGLSVIELFNQGTLEMYHGGIYPDESTYCGKCWLKLYNSSDVPGERTIDWNKFKDDIKGILDALDHFKADKNHPYYKFLLNKYNKAKVWDALDMTEEEKSSYTLTELTALYLIPDGKRLEIPQDFYLENYKDLKELMKNFGGKYSKNGFTFTQDAIEVLNRILKKETSNLKKTYQFYATPSSLCEKLCEMTFDPMMNKSIKILEPSAGHGSIIDSILGWHLEKSVHLHIDSITSIEYMKENFDLLKDKYKNEDRVKLIHGDFLKYDEYINYFDLIIANPPFSGAQDIKHIKHMYDLCKWNGIITCIMSVNWLHNNQKKYKEFREWLGIKDKNGKDIIHRKLAAKGLSSYEGYRLSPYNKKKEKIVIKTYEAGKFKESGTNVITCVVQIHKNDITGVGSFNKKNNQLTFF